jgi:sec-independent protein translocase protein TatA
MGNIGAWEIALIVLVILLVFGPKRLPQMGRSLGRGMREFKETVTDQTRELKEATADAPKQFKDALNPMVPTEKPVEAPAEAAAAAAPTPAAAPAPAPVAATVVVEEPVLEGEVVEETAAPENGQPRA